MATTRLGHPATNQSLEQTIFVVGPEAVLHRLVPNSSVDARLLAAADGGGCVDVVPTSVANINSARLAQLGS